MRPAYRTRLSGNRAPRKESRFEQAEIGPVSEAAARAYFGRKLERLFPLPAEHSEPPAMRQLLREIETKLRTSQ
jgi:hypothetical protein